MNDNSYKVIEVDINEILPNRFQPRIQFDEEEILELSDSIKEHGVIQPIIVRTIGDKYEIIAGERRYKASVLAGKETVPVIIKNLNDKDSAEIALIENIQRKNLTPIEEALSYKKILDMGYLTQESLAIKLGKSQSSVANKVRLLNLSDEVQEALLDNKISERHARSLLRLKSTVDQNGMLERIITERMTVRKTDEEIDKKLKGISSEEPKKEEKGEINMNNEINQIPNVVTPQGSTFDIFGGGQQVAPATSEQTIQTPAAMPEVPQMPGMQFGTEPPSVPVMEMPSASVVPETPVMPEVPQMPGMQFGIETPSVPTMEMPSVPTMEMPSTQVVPETPVMPEIPQMPGMQFGIETPSVPTMEMPSAPVVPETPTMPEIPQMPGMQFGIETPSVPTMEMPSAPVVPETPVMPEVPQTSPIIDSSINNSPVVEIPTMQVPKVEPEVPAPPTANEMMNQEPIIITDYTKQYDPVMPNAQPEPTKVDFKEIINAIRECSKKIEQFGYRIDVEEYDLSTLYQVVFKIEK